MERLGNYKETSLYETAGDIFNDREAKDDSSFYIP